MKKLKKITLADGHELSAVEMAMLEGVVIFHLNVNSRLKLALLPIIRLLMNY